MILNFQQRTIIQQQNKQTITCNIYEKKWQKATAQFVLNLLYLIFRKMIEARLNSAGGFNILKFNRHLVKFNAERITAAILCINNLPPQASIIHHRKHHYHSEKR